MKMFHINKLVAFLLLIALSVVTGFGGNLIQTDPNEPNNNLTTATAIELPFFSEKLQIELADDLDYFSFQINHLARINIRLSSIAGLDPILRVLDSEGQLLTSADDTESRDARIEMVLTEGQYYVEASGFGVTTGTYRLQISTSNAPEDVELPFSSGPRDISSSSQQDAFSFSVDETTWIQADIDSIENNTRLDAMLILIDQRGQIVASNDDFDRLDPYLEIELQSGNYHIFIVGFGGSIGSYELFLQSVDVPSQRAPTSPEQIQGGPRTNTQDAPGHIELPFESEELSISPDNTRDAFSFQLEKETLVIANVDAAQIGSSLDAVLTLEDANGNVVASNDDSNGLDPKLQEIIGPGRYTLIVHGFNIFTTGIYVLHVQKTILTVGNELCVSSSLRTLNSDSWQLGRIEPGQQLQVVLEIEPDSEFVISLIEVISETPSVTIGIADTTISNVKGVLVYDVTGEKAKTFLVQVSSLSGSSDYSMCWSPNVQ